jgi:lysophospholipase L1-like esterase
MTGGMRLAGPAASFLLLLGSCGVALTAAEVVLRLTRSGTDPREYSAFRKSATPGLDYEFVPGARVPWAGRDIRINGDGFRGPEFTREAVVHPRIAVIGDSVAAGYGVAEADAFPFRLGWLMRDQGIAGEVLDFGTPGYNIGRIVVLWERKVRSYKPDVVIYALSLNDALPELTLTAQGLVPTGGIELAPERAAPGRVPLPGKRWLHAHSLLYQLLVTRYDLLLQRFGFRAEPIPPVDQVNQLYAAGAGSEDFRANVRRLAESVRAEGAEFLILCFPLADQLTARRPEAQAALAAWTQDVGIAFVDLYPAFAARASMDGVASLFLEDGLHPAPQGHALAAEELLPFSRRLGAVSRH